MKARNTHSRQHSTGFTLIELVVVIGVLGLLIMIMVGMTASLITQQRLATTRSKIANIDSALVLYVSQYKRLPCPADGTLDSTNATAGVEIVNVGPPRTCVNNQLNGVVPWRALGLAAIDIEDGWGGRITYRVGPGLVQDNAMDFSGCDPAGGGPINPTAPLAPYCTPTGSLGTQCNAGTLASVCTTPARALAGSPDTSKGILVTNIAGTIVMDPRSTDANTPSTGAAYVIISHGQEGGGAFSAQGVMQGSTVTAGTAEAMNFPNLAYSAPPLPAGSASPALIDDSYMGQGATHFDDIVSRPSVLSVASKAQLGPRAH